MHRKKGGCSPKRGGHGHKKNGVKRHCHRKKSKKSGKFKKRPGHKHVKCHKKGRECHGSSSSSCSSSSSSSSSSSDSD